MKSLNRFVLVEVIVLFFIVLMILLSSFEFKTTLIIIFIFKLGLDMIVYWQLDIWFKDMQEMKGVGE